MITKEQFTESLLKEITIIRHLASKIKEDQLTHRPTENQRSLGELLQYLSYVFATTIERLQTGDASVYMSKVEEAKNTTLENFDVKMAEQEIRIRELMSSMTESQLAEEVDFYSVQSRAMHLLNGVLKWATAYKMQLFLYMKATGYFDLSTLNLWVGMDTKPKE